MSWSSDSHPSPHELLLAADGELTRGRLERVRLHLNECPRCRSRMREIEASLETVLLAQRSVPIPPLEGPRAVLKMRLSQLSAAFARTPWRIFSLPSSWRYAAVPLLVALTALLALRLTVLRQPDAVFASTPRLSLTPGATRHVSLEDVCPAGLRERPRVIPAAVQKRVFDEYGISNAEPRAFEVDYLITPELGGADDIRNLWPQPYFSTVWNARVKDSLEDRLHRLVCAGQLDLATAQREISADWIAAYKKYFHTNTPLESSGVARD